MKRRYIGDLEILVEYCGRTIDDRAMYRGAVVLPSGKRWHFSNLAKPSYGSGQEEEDYDLAAKIAVDFGTYYTSENRDGDVPDWAPSTSVADDMYAAGWGGMRYDKSGTKYIVRRERNVGCGGEDYEI